MTQEQALKIMKTGVNIYLTGSAGSGKTYLLNQYIQYLQEHDVPVAVTASTGIAATHMNGMTIHGWSGIGIRDKMDERDLEQIEDKKYLWKRFEKARVLIIDEVSMLHGFQLEMLEKICRRFKRNNQPFGGLQIILSGDFFQLPPVQKNNQATEMVYENKAWKILKPAVCYLTEQHRQADENLTNILNAIRDDSVEQMHYEYLESCVGRDLGKDKKATKLYTHNVNVDNENNTELEKISNSEVKYQMTSMGPDILVDILKKSCLAHEELRLKIGAEVMCIKNNFEEGYVNGSRGKVIGFSHEGAPMVRLYNGKNIVLEPESWVIEENGKIKASISQIPLRLAWAITIHKSQGLSLDHALIDLRSTFAYGMGYVALSRVRTLDGIKLIGFNPDALKVDPKVLEFDRELRNESYQNELLFQKLKNQEQEKMEKSFIERMGGTFRITRRKKEVNGKIINTKIPTVLITKELLEEGRSIKEIAKIRNLVFSTIIHHIEQIVSEYPETVITHIRPPQKNIDIVKKANEKLKGEDAGKLTPIKKILEKEKNKMSFEDIRLARLFI